jgi:hypothetical protein
VVKGHDGEASAAVGSGSSVSRHRAGKPKAEDVLSEGDYQAYLERLGRYRKRSGVSVYAYCLMPNQCSSGGGDGCPAVVEIHAYGTLLCPYVKPLDYKSSDQRQEITLKRRSLQSCGRSALLVSLNIQRANIRLYRQLAAFPGIKILHKISASRRYFLGFGCLGIEKRNVIYRQAFGSISTS